MQMAFRDAIAGYFMYALVNATQCIRHYSTTLDRHQLMAQISNAFYNYSLGAAWLQAPPFNL